MIIAGNSGNAGNAGKMLVTCSSGTCKSSNTCNSSKMVMLVTVIMLVAVHGDGVSKETVVMLVTMVLVVCMSLSLLACLQKKQTNKTKTKGS